LRIESAFRTTSSRIWVSPATIWSEKARLLKAQEIDTKYLADYQALFRRLVELGKAYAAQHNIKVDWQTRMF